MQTRFHVLDHRPHVAVFDEDAQCHGAPTRLAGDVHGPRGLANGAHRAQTHIAAIGRGQRDGRHARQLTLGVGQAHGHIELALAFPQGGGGFAGQGGLNHILDVADVEPVAGRALAVNFNQQLRQLAKPIHLCTVDATHLLDLVFDFFGGFAQLGQIVPCEFDHNLPVDLRNRLQHIVPNGLRKSRLHARQVGHHPIHLFDQGFLGHARSPLLDGFEVDKHLGHADGFGVGAVFGLTGFGHRGVDLWHREQGTPHIVQDARRLGVGDAGGQAQVDPNRALIELGQKLRTQVISGNHGQHERTQSHANHRLGVAQGPSQNRLIGALAKGNQAVVLVRQTFAQHRIRDQGHQGERKNQGADQGRGDRQGHGLEDAPFMALQRKNGYVGRDDDEHRKQRGAADFVGGAGNHMATLFVAHALTTLRQAMHDVFSHDDRTIHDDAKVHRTQAEQIGRYPHDFQAHEGRQQRQRDDHHHRQAGAHIGQKQIQHQGHQQGAFDQIFEHREQRFFHQPCAVIKRHHLNPGRQSFVVEVGDFFLHLFQHHAGVFALAHDDNAGDHIVIAVLPHGAQARHRAHHHSGHVTDQNRCAAPVAHHNAANVIGLAQQANATDGKLL